MEIGWKGYIEILLLTKLKGSRLVFMDQKGFSPNLLAVVKNHEKESSDCD